MCASALRSRLLRALTIVESPDLRGSTQTPRERLIPVMPCDLFDHVHLAGGIRPEGRDRHLQDTLGRRRALEPDRPEVRGNLVVAEGGTEDGIQAGGPQRDPEGSGDVASHVDRTGEDSEVRTCRLSEHLAQPPYRSVDAFGITASFEARRSLGPQAEPRCGPRNGHRSEVGGLEHDPAGRIGDLGRCAPHHSPDPDRHVVAVADDAVPQIVAGTDRALGHSPLDPVERHDDLAGTRCPRAQGVPGHPVQVVGVGGLAELEHHVIGGIHDVV